MTHFGVVSEIECNFELYKLIKNDKTKLPLQANAFFELFLENANK